MAEGKVGLVLAGGGARGAFEAGALEVLLPALAESGNPVKVVIGTSVGALHAAFLAAHRTRLAEPGALEPMLDLWRSLKPRDVIDRVVGPRAGVAGMRYLATVANLADHRIHGLLGTARLERTIAARVGFPIVAPEPLPAPGSVEGLEAAAVVATEASSSRSVVFVRRFADFELPGYDERRGIEYVDADLHLSHVLASAAIPAFFRAVEVEPPAARPGWYYDGGTRLNTPIKPALKLGVNRLVIVALNSLPPADAPPAAAAEPDLADGAMQLIQATLVDPLVQDVQTLARTNPLAGARRGARAVEEVEYVFVAPPHPHTLGAIATATWKKRHRSRIPPSSLRDTAVLGRALGDGEGPAHGEALSYVYFSREFTGPLACCGRRAAEQWIDRSGPAPRIRWHSTSLEPPAAVAPAPPCYCDPRATAPCECVAAVAQAG